MIKLSNHIIDIDDRMRFFAKTVYNKLVGLIHSQKKNKKKRRKIDQELFELLFYLEQIEALGYEMKLEVCTKKEVINGTEKEMKKSTKQRRRKNG